MVGCHSDSESVPTSAPSLGQSSEELTGAAGQLTSVGLFSESNKCGTHWTHAYTTGSLQEQEPGLRTETLGSSPVYFVDG